MLKLKITKIKKEILYKTNGNYFDVSFKAVDKDGNDVGFFRHAFPITKTDKEIEGELKKFLKTHNEEQQNFAKNKQKIEMEAKADNTIKNLSNKEIKNN